MLTYLSPSDVAGIAIDDVAPGPHGAADGYGTHATRYRVKLTDGRWRRVYVDVFGNGGAVYVKRAGERAYVSTEVEAMIEGAESMSLSQARAAARDWQSPGAVGRELATLASSGVATDALADDVRATLPEADGVETFRLLRLLGWSVREI